MAEHPPWWPPTPLTSVTVLIACRSARGRCAQRAALLSDLQVPIGDLLNTCYFHLSTGEVAVFYAPLSGHRAPPYEYHKNRDELRKGKQDCWNEYEHQSGRCRRKRSNEHQSFRAGCVERRSVCGICLRGQPQPPTWYPGRWDGCSAMQTWVDSLRHTQSHHGLQSPNT